MQAVTAHSTYCDEICQSQSGGNAILTVCLLPILSRNAVTAGILLITAAETSHHPQGRKNDISTGRSMIANTTTAVLWHRDGARRHMYWSVVQRDPGPVLSAE